MTAEHEAVQVVYEEICDAMKRAGARIGPRGSSGNVDTVVAAAMMMFLRRLPVASSILCGLLQQQPVPTNSSQN